MIPVECMSEGMMLLFMLLQVLVGLGVPFGITFLILWWKDRK